MKTQIDVWAGSSVCQWRCGSRPKLADELAVSHQAVYAVLAEEPDEALDDFNALGGVAVPALGQQTEQQGERHVHRFSKMLLHDWKKFANFASVLGISSFLHRKIGTFSLQSY